MLTKSLLSLFKSFVFPPIFWYTSVLSPTIRSCLSALQQLMPKELGRQGGGNPIDCRDQPFHFPGAPPKMAEWQNWRAGSWHGNESSCFVNRKQQEPWAQFTHTWHGARLRGVKSREKSHWCFGKTVLLMQSRPTLGSAGLGPPAPERVCRDSAAGHQCPRQGKKTTKQTLFPFQGWAVRPREGCTFTLF